MSKPTGETTLTIPGEYVEFFKLGLLNEIETDCGCLVSNAQELARKPAEWTDEDVQSTGGLLASDLRVLSQLPVGPAEGDVTVTAPNDGCLEHAAATTARYVIGPRLTDRMNYSPIEDDERARILALTEALNWAVNSSVAALNERVAAGEEA